MRGLFVHALPSTIQFSKNAPSLRFCLALQGVFVRGKKKFYSLFLCLSRGFFDAISKLSSQAQEEILLSSARFVKVELWASLEALRLAQLSGLYTDVSAAFGFRAFPNSFWKFYRSPLSKTTPCSGARRNYTGRLKRVQEGFEKISQETLG